MSPSSLTVRDHGWQQLVKAAREMAGGAYARVGVLADTEKGGLHEVEPDGKSSPLTVAEIAAVHEFGTEDGHIPQRSFMRSTFGEQREVLQEMSKKILRKIVFERSMSVEQGLNILAAKLAAEMKKTITIGDKLLPNAPSTLRRKEAAGRWNRKGKAQAAGLGPRPLVDTGRLVQAITFAVVSSRAARVPLK